MENLRADFKPKELIDEVGYSNFSGIRDDMRNDYDYPIVIVGDERDGKTTLAMIICLIINAFFSIKDIVFPTSELLWRIAHARLYDAILQDEGAETWLSVDSNSREGRKIIRLFMEVGAKNLAVIICIPDVQLVQRYLKKHRAKVLIRILGRGRYAFYSKKRIKDIKFNRDTQTIHWPEPNFVGWWKKIPPTSAFWKAYLEKKGTHLGHKAEDPRVLETQLKMEKFMRSTVGAVDAARMLGLKEQTFRKWVREGKLKKKFKINVIKTQLHGQRFLIREITRKAKSIHGVATDSY